MTGQHVNDVEVDLDADIAAIAAAGEQAEFAEVAAERQSTVDQNAHAEAWLQDATDAIDVAVGMIVPAWELTDKDRARMAVPLSRLLDRWMPGGMAGVDNWHPLWQLGAAVSVVAVTRGVDWETGQFRPLQINNEAENGDGETAGRNAPVPNGYESVGKDGGGFSMGGG